MNNDAPTETAGEAGMKTIPGKYLTNEIIISQKSRYQQTTSTAEGADSMPSKDLLSKTTKFDQFRFQKGLIEQNKDTERELEQYRQAVGWLSEFKNFEMFNNRFKHARSTCRKTGVSMNGALIDTQRRRDQQQKTEYRQPGTNAMDGNHGGQHKTLGNM